MNSKTNDTLEILDNWSKRLEGHCSLKRSSKRFDFREQISVIVPDVGSGPCDGEDYDTGIIIVTARNLSRTGVSFLHSKNLPSDKIIVALTEGQQKFVYLESKIVRRRQVHNGLWEFGAQFIERIMM